MRKLSVWRHSQSMSTTRNVCGGSTTGQGFTGLHRARRTIKRWVSDASDRFLWGTCRKMCTSKAEYDEVAAPGGSTELTGHIALANTRFVAVGACPPSWRLAESPVGLEPWRCHGWHGTFLLRACELLCILVLCQDECLRTRCRS